MFTSSEIAECWKWILYTNTFSSLFFLLLFLLSIHLLYHKHDMCAQHIVYYLHNVISGVLSSVFPFLRIKVCSLYLYFFIVQTVKHTLIIWNAVISSVFIPLLHHFPKWKFQDTEIISSTLRNVHFNGFHLEHSKCFYLLARCIIMFTCKKKMKKSKTRKQRITKRSKKKKSKSMYLLCVVHMCFSNVNFFNCHLRCFSHSLLLFTARRAHKYKNKNWNKIEMKENRERERARKKCRKTRMDHKALRRTDSFRI